MSDSSNPFAALAGKFPDAKGKKGASGSVVVRPASSGSSSAGKGRKVAPAPQPDLDEDAALFLDSMQSIKPLSRKKVRDDEEPTMADALKAVLPESQAPQAKGKAGATHAQTGMAHATSRPAAQAPSQAEAKPSAASRPQLGAGSTEKSPSATDAAWPPAGTQAKTAVRNARDIPESAFTIQSQEEPAQEDLFSKAMRDVAPIAAKGREVMPPVAEGTGLSQTVDPAQALHDLLEGRVEFALYNTDEYMEGHVVGVDPAILGRMRAGQISPEAHLDLHGQNARQAFDSLTWFIKNSYQRNLRTVTVVTGRGKNSPNGVGILRPLLQEWLTKDPFKRVVLAFCTAPPSDGGPGAVYVLLRKYKKSRGKIIWEHAAPEADIEI